MHDVIKKIDKTYVITGDRLYKIETPRLRELLELYGDLVTFEPNIEPAEETDNGPQLD